MKEKLCHRMLAATAQSRFELENNQLCELAERQLSACKCQKQCALMTSVYSTEGLLVRGCADEIRIHMNADGLYVV